jgi:hypothetical protein
MHPPSSSPDLIAAPVESVVESGRVLLVAHVLRVKRSSAWMFNRLQASELVSRWCPGVSDKHRPWASQGVGRGHRAEEGRLIWRGPQNDFSTPLIVWDLGTVPDLATTARTHIIWLSLYLGGTNNVTNLWPQPHWSTDSVWIA